MPLNQTAFSSGFSSGSNAITSAGQLRVKKQLAEQQKREQFMKQYQARVKQAADNLNKGVQNIYATSKNPQEDINKLKTSFSGIQSGLTKEGQLLGVDPQITTQLFENIYSQPSPAQLAEQKSTFETAAQPVSTPAGKAIIDREVLKRIYSEDSPQVRAFDEAMSSTEKDTTTTSGLRKEFTNQSQDYIKVRDAFSKVEGALPTAAGDLSMIFNYMKMLDPPSVVREGEQATAANARGVPETIRTVYNRVLTGERLGVDQRKDFIENAKIVMQTQLGHQKQLESEYSRIATKQKLDPSLVIVDFKQKQKPKEEQQKYKEGDTISNPQTGERMVRRGGKWIKM